MNKGKQGLTGGGAGRSGYEQLPEGLLTHPAHVAAQHSMGRHCSSHVMSVHGYVALAVGHAFVQWHR